MMTKMMMMKRKRKKGALSVAMTKTRVDLFKSFFYIYTVSSCGFFLANFLIYMINLFLFI